MSDEKAVTQEQPTVEQGGLDSLIKERREQKKAANEQKRKEKQAAMPAKSEKKVVNKPKDDKVPEQKKLGITIERIYTVIVNGLPKTTEEEIKMMVKQQIGVSNVEAFNKGANWFIKFRNENKAMQLIGKLDRSHCKESGKDLHAFLAGKDRQ